MTMFLVARLILFRQQLKEKSHEKCRQCYLPYDESLGKCPHCAILSESEVEELIERQKRSKREPPSSGTVFFNPAYDCKIIDVCHER